LDSHTRCLFLTVLPYVVLVAIDPGAFHVVLDLCLVDMLLNPPELLDGQSRDGVGDVLGCGFDPLVLIVESDFRRRRFRRTTCSATCRGTGSPRSFLGSVLRHQCLEHIGDEFFEFRFGNIRSNRHDARRRDGHCIITIITGTDVDVRMYVFRYVHSVGHGLPTNTVVV
jgi:hypothetical protein